MKYKYLLPVFFFFSGISLVLAQENLQEEEMITDRPDETEAPTLVNKGFLQVESGFFIEEREGEILEKTTGYNTTLLRYGLLSNLELRIGFDVVKIREENIAVGEKGVVSTGLEPLLLGAKIGIAEEKGAFPEIGFMGHIYLPFVAAEDLKPETTGVDFRFAFSHDFGNSDLSYNLGAKWWEDTASATFIYTVAYGFDITENLGAFGELYGDLPENSGAEHNWDAGLTYNLKNNIQLDAFVGTGINGDQKIKYGAGLSFRIPN